MSVFSSLSSHSSLFSLYSFWSFFYLLQFLSSFLKYSSSNFLSSHPYNSFVVYFPGNSILLYSLLSCHLTSIPNLSLRSSTSSFAFPKSSTLSHMLLSTVNPFHHTKYFSTPLIFLLFRIFSTSYSSTPSTFISFPFSFLCPFTCSSYWTTWLTLTTEWILIKLGSCSLTTFVNTTSSISYSSTCHIQAHPSGNYIPAVISSPNYTSLSSTAATFLTTCLIAVLQPSGYSTFHSRDTSIQLSLPWQSYPCQYLNTETSAQSNRSFTTETLSISYNIYLYIRLVVTL